MTAPMTAPVLIIENIDLNLKFYRAVLEEAGYEVVTSRDGKNVTLILAEQPPGLILLDIENPSASTRNLPRHLKDSPAFRDIPILAVADTRFKSQEEAIFEAGFDDYVVKPLAIPEFLEKVGKLMTEKALKSSSGRT